MPWSSCIAEMSVGMLGRRPKVHLVGILISARSSRRQCNLVILLWEGSISYYNSIYLQLLYLGRREWGTVPTGKIQNLVLSKKRKGKSVWEGHGSWNESSVHLHQCIETSGRMDLVPVKRYFQDWWEPVHSSNLSGKMEIFLSPF